MPTAEELIRQTVEETRRKSLAALDQGQSEGAKAAQAAQANIKAQQAEALNRLLADARTRGYTGGADTLAAEMTGPADRRVQSIDQGLGGRNQDYAYRKSALGDLYGRIEALAPQLGAQVAAAQAAARRGRGGGGGGSGGGSGAGPWSTQEDVLTEILDRITADDTVQETMDYERLLSNLGGGLLGDVGQALLRQKSYNIADAGGALASMTPDEWNDLYLSTYRFRPVKGRSFLVTMLEQVAKHQASSDRVRAALQRAFDDAIYNKTRVQTRTQSRTQSTNKDKANSRRRQRTAAPVIGRLLR